MDDASELEFAGELDRHLLSDVSKLCEEIHKNPELGWSEHLTQQTLR